LHVEQYEVGTTMSNLDDVEVITTRAQMASELRLLGFSEYAIQGILEMSLFDIDITIKKYKDALDLMGDETD
jgi:hypothetical protein